MKVVVQEIECIAYFNTKGFIRPLRFKYINQDGSEKVIKVDKVVDRANEKLCGNPALIFDCQSIIDGVEKVYQLKYFVMEMKWLLWKI